MRDPLNDSLNDSLSVPPEPAASTLPAVPTEPAAASAAAPQSAPHGPPSGPPAGPPVDGTRAVPGSLGADRFGYRPTAYPQPSYAPPAYSPSPYPQAGFAVGPSTYLVPAVLATLFCFMPLGLVALVYAARVTAYLDNGDTARAHNASHEAKKWCLWSLGVAVVGSVVFFGFWVMLFAAATSGHASATASV